jgi:hypothetical protein
MYAFFHFSSSVDSSPPFAVFVVPQAPAIPAGPFWIWAYVDYTPVPRVALNVTSYFAFFALDANPYGAGNHYCHLLSPARAMEHIYIDALRV